MKPILTVFTPTYNRAYILGRCYESMKRQTFKDFVWLIIDDGSTDNTRELVERWISEGTVTIRYNYQENQGMHGAHNTAYELIDTELNVCIDSDDYMPEDAVEKIVTFWIKNGNRKVSGIVGLDSYADGNIIGTRLPKDMEASTLFDLYNKHGVKGDKKIVYRSELTKQYPYPIFSGEKYVNLAYKYAALDKEYELLLMDEVLCYVEYLPDGSSKNMLRQYIRNPKGFAFWRIEAMKLPYASPGFKYRQAIHLVSSSLISRNRLFLRETPCKLLTLLALPFGVLLYFYIKIRTLKVSNECELIKPLRVLQVAGGMNAGGAETMIMHLYRKIDRSKLQFDFISFTQDKCHFDDEIRSLGGRIYYIEPPQSRNPIKFIMDIYRVIKRYGPYHAVHAHTLFNSGWALLAARLSGVKIRVCHSHNTLGDFNHVFIRKIYFVVMRVLIKLNTNKNVACTKAAGKFLFGGKKSQKQKFSILYNAIDLSPYKRIDLDEVENMRKSLGIGRNTLVIGHVGKFGEQKNHIFLVKLAEFLKGKVVDFKILLIGQGNLKDYIESVVNKNGLDKYIEFLGVQTNIPLFMRMFDVFVFPSLYEGLGIVLIEAQAACTPCVISDTIPEECDMGLDLIKRVNLNDNLEVWYEAICQNNRIQRPLPETAISAIFKKGYNLNTTIKTLKNIYELD